MFFMFGYPNASIVSHGSGIGSDPPCTLFSRPTKCVRDNYFLEKNIFTSKNETSESPSAKKIMTRELFGRVGIVR